jgi:hypothetical protein
LVKTGIFYFLIKKYNIPSKTLRNALYDFLDVSKEITPYLVFRLSSALLWFAEKKIFFFAGFLFFAIGVRTQAKAQRR